MKLWNKLFFILFGWSIATLMISCTDKRALIYDSDSGAGDSSNNVKIATEIDWSSLSEEPSAYTLIFYPIDGSDPTLIVVDSDTPEISLEPGEYSVIIFNGTMESHSELTFSDVDEYQSIKASFSDTSDVDVSMYNLYTDNNDYINITSDEDSLSFKLSDSATVLHVTVYISSINKLSDSDHFAIITGFASGLYLSSRLAADDESISINVPLLNITYNYDSTTDGYLRDQIKCFGVYSSDDTTTSNEASIYLKMESSGQYTKYDVDVTDDIKIVDGDSQVLDLSIANISAD